MRHDSSQSFALNGICPYFTMFPLDFPYAILHRHATPGDWVLDPFCGRGTTNYASRLLGLRSIGIDSSPVAVAVSQAKLANATPEGVIDTVHAILQRIEEPQDVPHGEFWEWAYHPKVLNTLCRLREGLREECRTDDEVALRAILLGALHGPRLKTKSSYLSNQSQRTYAPKPRYAVKFWKMNSLQPPDVDVLEVIRQRAARYFGSTLRAGSGAVIHGDSRNPSTFDNLRMQVRAQWVITSPPYYGMRTYIPDQWLRNWFLGGPDHVSYSMEGQIGHSSPDTFAEQLRQVWRNVGSICEPGARLVVRFGGIHDRKADPLAVLKRSLADSGWSVINRRTAGFASQGRRQALHFSRPSATAMEEWDLWARWGG